MKNRFLISISVMVLAVSCRKDRFINTPDARISISTEAVKFDTVFTSSGSVTQFFKIINENDRKLRLSSVELVGGSSSYFNINVDGFTGPQIPALDIAANDSVYVFVSVNVDPSADNLPFVVEDSIQIHYNGNSRRVKLEAWGQNAHFFRDKTITTDEIWDNDLPYVILGSFIIDPNRKLTINKGCRIYVHADAPILVDGTLEVIGEKDSSDRVRFRSDRLDEPYSDFPAGWPGIFFTTTSMNNVLTYADIRNAYQALALVDPSPNANPKLVLNECTIDNAYDAGIIALNSSIRARNCQVSNSGKNILLVKGGDYQFTHCTVATVSNAYIFHRDPVLIVSNYITVNNSPLTADLNAVFTNCIFWGENGLVDDEVVVSKSGNTIYNVLFDHNLWKLENQPSNIISNQNITNEDPLFDSINVSKRIFNLRLKEGSPGINSGVNTSVTIDLDGNPRPVGMPDLGCFENQ